MDRRNFLKVSGGALAALAASGWLRPRRAGAAPRPAARACIVLWMNGGPSHLDTWDPKPGQKSGGPFKAIPTRAAGVSICEHLPRLAERADALAILRGMTSKEGNHQRAHFLLHTGYAPNPTVQHPSLGAWISEEVGDPKNELPPFVSVQGPSAGAGFLGVQHGPFVVARAGLPPEDTAYARDVDFVRFLRRKGALTWMEERFADETGDAKARSRRAVYDRAVRMMYAPKLRAFDLAEEPDAVRAAYGDSDFGRGCLLARRLIESGVRYVEVTLDGWDTHQDNFGRTAKLMAALDPAMAALISDLDARKLLGETLVVWMGEFGRTPAINPRDGRDHFPGAWSAVVAGGGIRGGQVLGATSDDGTKVVAGATQVPDLMATIVAQLGIDPDKEMETPLGRPVSITQNGRVLKQLL
jgi:hypothetical protein